MPPMTPSTIMPKRHKTWRSVVSGLCCASLLAQPLPSSAMVFTAGGFSVDGSGSASYSIPIAIPPGVSGMQPQLAFGYSSQGGNGLMGVGWGLSGLSAVSRCPRTPAQDGVRGGVLFDSNDKFCLDGQRLIAISGTYGANNTEYRTERESFAKIVSYGTAGNGPSYFKVWSKSGQIMEFGNTTDSKVEGQGISSVRVWALNKISDTKGNYFTVTYTEDTTNGDYYPDRIDYTGNAGASLTPAQSVRFTYATRPDIVPLYQAGSLIRNTVRLTNVKTYVGSSVIRDYRLAYQTSTATSRSQITTVTECTGASVCLAATTVSWSSPTNSFGTDVSWGTRADSFTGSGGGVQLYDMNADGLADLVYDANAGVRVMLNSGTAFGTDTNWGSRSQSYNGNAPGLRFADINRDGLTDVIYEGASNTRIKLSTGTGFSTETTWGTRTYSYNTNDATRYHVVDVNGDNYPDLVYESASNGVRVMLSNGSTLGTDTSWGTRTQSFNSSGGGSKMADVNGDGFPDLVYDGTNGMRVLLNNGGSGFGTDTAWGARTDTYTSTGPGFQLADMNGDGLPDVVYDGNAGVRVMINTGTTFSTDTNWGTRSQSYTSTAAGLRLLDANSDGKTDVLYDAGNGVHVLLSTGTAFTTDAVWGTRSANINTGNASRLLAQDVGIDGRGDVGYDGDSGGFHILPTSGIISDLIVSIANGISHTTTITYKPLGDSSVYTKDTTATYPVRDLIFPMFVVSSYTTTDGIGGTYQITLTYTGLKADLEGRGLLGFKTMTVNAPTSGSETIKTITAYRQDYPYVGLPSQVKKTKANGTSVLNQVDTTYSCTDFVSGSGCTLATGRRYFAYASQSVEASNDTNGTALPTVTTTSSFDTYGNPTQIVVSTPDGYSKTTTNTYTNDTTNWFLGRLTRATVASTTP